MSSLRPSKLSISDGETHSTKNFYWTKNSFLDNFKSICTYEQSSCLTQLFGQQLLAPHIFKIKIFPDDELALADPLLPLNKPFMGV